MRFNSVAEVKEWAERAAASDFKMLSFARGLTRTIHQTRVIAGSA